jgi:probable HAF family extracellular repeat protein
MSAAAESGGNGINNLGQITGYIGADAYIYDGTIHDIGSLGGIFSEGNAINNIGHVGGGALTPQGIGHAFYYDGTIHDLGTLGGTLSIAYGINDDDAIVGISNPDPTNEDLSHGYIYTRENGMVDLNDFIDPQSGWLITEANAINNAGEIAGTGVIDGQPHAVLLTPVPEPSASTLAALTAVGLLIGRRNRHSRI